MKKYLMTGLAAAAVLTGATQAQAATLTVDTFNSGAQNASTNTAGTISLAPATGTGAGILGGEREGNLQYLGGTTFADININSAIVGQYAHSNGVGTSSKGTVFYDGVGSVGLGLDASLYNKFVLDIVDVDLTAQITLMMMDNGGNTASLVRSGLNAGNADFLFSSFTGIGSLDLTNIKSITMMTGGPANVDLQIDALFLDMPNNRTTPEPSVLLGLGLIAGAGLLRKKMQA